MKKLVVLALVLVVSSFASAAVIDLQNAGSEIVAAPGDIINIIVEGTDVLSLDAKVAITGGEFAILSATNAANADAGFSAPPVIAADGVQFVEGILGALANPIATVELQYNGGQVDISLLATTLAGGSVDAMTGGAIDVANIGAAGGITIVPEPATLAILGLGGLLIRRKK